MSAIEQELTADRYVSHILLPKTFYFLW